ncbi:Protein of unknown function [Pseudomonas sp. ok272]|nr:Protein of unknown function [Pseudomonas sp. ok272]SFM50770.1 Protein of unknown function [Pseudomonas sp. ok602]
MKKFICVSVLTAVLAPLAVQASSVDLSVTGTIIPTSCLPSFAGGNRVDLGRISISSLSPIAQTDLPQRAISLHIACDAPAPVEIAVTDNRNASKVPGLIFNGRSGSELYYGLGSTQGIGIGGFGLLSGQPMTDGQTRVLLMRTPADPTWRGSVNGLVGNAPTSYSWGQSVAAGPIAARLHSFPMNVVAAIRPTDDLPPTTDEFDLDGSVTFDVYYL